MTNTSATGGYLLPAAAPAPLEGQALAAFLQGWVAGVSGITPTSLVRPRWQPEPPNIPQAHTCWAAVGVTRRAADEYPFVGHNGAAAGGLGADCMQRHETMDVLCSFYDTGVTGQADFYSAQFRDGAVISQNLATLREAGMALVRATTPVTVPSLFKQRWLYRVDLEVVIRRQIDRQYPVENLVAASGDVYTDGGLPPQPWAVQQAEDELHVRQRRRPGRR